MSWCNEQKVKNDTKDLLDKSDPIYYEFDSLINDTQDLFSNLIEELKPHCDYLYVQEQIKQPVPAIVDFNNSLKNYETKIKKKLDGFKDLVSDEYKNVLGDKLKLEDELEEIKKEKENLEEEVASLKKEKEKLEKDLSDQEDKVSELEDENNKLEKQLDLVT
jgi:chromosome segregation ATPase